MALKTSAYHSTLFVTPGAIIHLHPLPLFRLETGDVLAPDVAAVSADPVAFEGTKCICCGVGAVASLTFDAGELDVLDVRKVGVLRLASIDEPRDLPVRRNIFFNKFLFVG